MREETRQRLRKRRRSEKGRRKETDRGREEENGRKRGGRGDCRSERVAFKAWFETVERLSFSRRRKKNIEIEEAR